MYLSTCKKALKAVLKAENRDDISQLPKPVLVGDSGIGKTAIVRSLFDELVEEGFFNKDKSIFIEKHLGQLELGDLIGLPDLDSDKSRTVWRAPCWWPDEDMEGILFFDEFGDTRNDVQRAVQQLMLEHKLYEHILPKKVFIVLAMNPVGSEFGSYDFSRQLKNRLMFWNIEPSVEEWLKYVYSLDTIFPSIDSIVTSIPNGLLEPVEFDVDKGYRNPRSIVAAAQLCETLSQESLKDFGFEVLESITGPVLASAILSEALSESSSYKSPISLNELLSLSIPDLKHKADTYNPVKDRDSLFSTVSVISSGFSELVNAEKFKELAVIIDILPDDLVSHCLDKLNKIDALSTMKIIRHSPSLATKMNKFNS